MLTRVILNRQICSNVGLASIARANNTEIRMYREEALDARALNVRRQLKRRKERVVTVVCHAVSWTSTPGAQRY